MGTLNRWMWSVSAVLVLALPACNGLPPIGEDRDGDGVPDIIDQCPDEAGPVENLGCPIVPPAEYDCANPPAISGFVPVKDAIAGRFIVRLKDTGATANISSFTALETFAKRFNGVEAVKPLGLVRAFSAKIDAKSLKAILADGHVQYVQQEGRRKLVALSWGLDRVDQRDRPLNGSFDPQGDGLGIHAYVNDTGVTPINDLAGRVSPDCFSTITFRGCEDAHGHGTHVSGSIGGTAWGVAKRVMIHSARFLDENGSGSDSDAIRSLDWIAQHYPGGRKVVNASWGGSPSPAVDEAVCKVIESGEFGTVFVAAAGNDGADSRSSTPARIKQVIVVGATDDSDRMAVFSNFGPGVDTFAPGVDIESDTPTGGTTRMSGTSMASPHVAGAVALFLQRHPEATVAAVEAGIIAQASKDKLSGIGEGSPNRLLYVKEN